MTRGIKLNYVPWYRIANLLKSNMLDMSPMKENVINHIQCKILINKWHLCSF